jgi:hypothetical protein
MRLNKMNMDAAEYSFLLSIQQKNQKVFSEQQIGGRKRLYIGEKMVGSTVSGFVDLEELSSGQFASFLGMFNRNLYAQIAKNDLLGLKVNFKGVSRSKNHKLYDSLPEMSIFHNIDLKSAYWQIARRLKYISEPTYLKYIHKDQYKSVKRLCISFLARPNKMTYHTADGYINTIHCDISMLKNVYENIRNELYRIINGIADKVEHIEYNIDGITVLTKDKQKVKDYFDNLNLEYKINFCVKLNEFQYQSGSKIKNFRRRTINN